MTPNFAAILLIAIVFALSVLGFFRWRFGWTDMLVFAIVSGLFTAVMDYISSFVALNYEYPGQSRLWVAVFIFFGWIGTCGTCLLLAEGILAGHQQDMISESRLRWRVPFLTAIIAVVFDLFLDPIAVEAGYWVWFVEGTVYYDIPLLNYVGWFVLMFLAPLAWILIVRHDQWGPGTKLLVSLAALIPLCIAAVLMSLLMNGAIAALGVS